MADYTFGELFSGPGGLSLGLRMAATELGIKVRHKWAVEIDPSAADTYRANFPDSQVINDDIRRVQLDELPSVNGMAFGFPCNDFSVVGEQLGKRGKFGPLYRHCVAAVSAHKPKWFVAENVGGIRSADGGLALPNILREFEELGYVLTPHLFRFEQYGIPQRRHRVLIVGIKTSLRKRFLVPRATTAHKNSQKSAKVAIENPPISAGAFNNELTKQSPIVVERLQALRPGENAFSESLPKRLRLNIKGARISQIYKRLMPHEPAYTITGSGGGGTHVYHWKEPRALTNRERARLQTFPDDFRFEGSKEAVRRQIGMAVPPEGAAVVFKALFMTLRGESYAHEASNLGAAYLSRQLGFEELLLG